MKKLVIIIIFAIVSITLLSTCEHEPLVPPSKPSDTAHIPVDTTHHGNGCSKDTVYFTNTILPLIISNCAMPGCHDAITMREGLNLTSYSAIAALVRPGNPTGSRLYRVLSSSDDKMPPNSSLTSVQINEIYTWILQGAKQNTCTDSSGCDSMNVKYSSSIVPILTVYCIGCHNAKLVSGGVTLDTYMGASTVAKDGQLIGGVTGALSRMPKYGNPLSACDIGKIRKWVNNGAPNN